MDEKLAIFLRSKDNYFSKRSKKRMKWVVYKRRMNEMKKSQIRPSLGERTILVKYSLRPSLPFIFREHSL